MFCQAEQQFAFKRASRAQHQSIDLLNKGKGIGRHGGRRLLVFYQHAETARSECRARKRRGVSLDVAGRAHDGALASNVAQEFAE